MVPIHDDEGGRHPFGGSPRPERGHCLSRARWRPLPCAGSLPGTQRAPGPAAPAHLGAVTHTDRGLPCPLVSTQEPMPPAGSGSPGEDMAPGDRATSQSVTSVQPASCPCASGLGRDALQAEPLPGAASLPLAPLQGLTCLQCTLWPQHLTGPERKGPRAQGQQAEDRLRGGVHALSHGRELEVCAGWGAPRPHLSCWKDPTSPGRPGSADRGTDLLPLGVSLVSPRAGRGHQAARTPVPRVNQPQAPVPQPHLSAGSLTGPPPPCPFAFTLKLQWPRPV